MSLALRKTIQKLQKYTNSSSPIISVYLPVKAHDHDLLNLLEQTLERSLVKRDYETLEPNITYVEGFLMKYKPGSSDQGLAIFSGGDNLFEAINTHFTLPSLIAVNHSPYLTPLYEHIDDYERYLVIITDREKARYFTIHNHELEDEGQFFKEHVPQKVKGRNLENRQKKIERHIQDHLHRHFKGVAEKVEDYIKDKPITGVIVGGHSETLPYLYKHLPKSLSNKVIGEFAAKPDADFDELFSKSKSILSNLFESIHQQPMTILHV